MIRYQPDQGGIENYAGVAWYRPEQWERLREISIDKDVLEETHAEWLQNAEKGLKEFRRQGVEPVKVDVDVEELLRWCESRGMAVDGKARANYTATKLRHMFQGNPDCGD